MKISAKTPMCWCVFCLVAPVAVAGTAFIDFEDGVGPLNYTLFGPGQLVAAADRASFTGPNVTLVADGGSAVSCTGTLTIKITLQPSVDAENLVGLFMCDVDDVSDQLTALTNDLGNVTLSGFSGNRNTYFTYPGAINNTMTLEYNTVSQTATLTLNKGVAGQERSVTLQMALDYLCDRVYIGVASGGPGGFEDFTATGGCVPDYPPQVVDTDNDGVSDEDEIAAGTDPEDPGNLPVDRNEGAVIYALNGAKVVIPPNALQSATLNVAVGAPDSIPPGDLPDDYRDSTAGLSLGPDGAAFNLPVTVQMPYAPSDVAGLDETTLTVFYFEDPDYSAGGIADVSVDTGAREVTFTTTHFTVFLIAGLPPDSDGDGVPDDEDVFPYNPFGATDSDGDGIGDEWEDRWFGNGDGVPEPDELAWVNELTDNDEDGIPDLDEFLLYGLGLNPTETNHLPVGPLATILLMTVFVGAVANRTRKSKTGGYAATLSPPCVGQRTPGAGGR